MSIKPCPTDANARRLLDSATDLICDQIPLTDAWKAIQFVNDIKAFSLYINSVSAGSVAFRGTLPSSKAWLDAAAAVDATGGKVDIAATAHGFTIGDSVTISGTVNYNGTHVLQSGGTANTLRITQTYVAETIPATAYAVGYRDVLLAAGAQTPELRVVSEADTTVCSLKCATGSATAVVSIYARR